MGGVPSICLEFLSGGSLLGVNLPLFPVLGALRFKNLQVTKDFDITLTVETHNFPCGIAPFPGAKRFFTCGEVLGYL